MSVPNTTAGAGEQRIMRLILVLMSLLLTVPVRAEPYWIAWEGDDWPENQGWNRAYGNWEGPGEGEAVRTLADGVLTYDSRHDTGVYDYCWMERPGALDPGPGELFVMEWGLEVDEIVEGSADFDPGVALFSDDSWGVGLRFSMDRVSSAFEHTDIAMLNPGEYYDYRLVSTDMRQYQLYLNGIFVYEGAFVDVFTESYLSWGDGTQGAGSLQSWNHFRFGVVPEPRSQLLVLTLLLVLRSARN